MTTAEHAATAARVFIVAAIAMAGVNSGVLNIARAQAEKLLDEYFARVEQAVP